MPRAILYFKEVNKFMTWSTIVDAPITYLLSEKDYRDYYKDEYGRVGMRDLDEKLKTAEETGCNWLGCNWLGHDIDDVILVNRAGDDETGITRKEIVKKYTA